MVFGNAAFSDMFTPTPWGGVKTPPLSCNLFTLVSFYNLFTLRIFLELTEPS